MEPRVTLSSFVYFILFGLYKAFWVVKYTSRNCDKTPSEQLIKLILIIRANCFWFSHSIVTLMDFPYYCFLRYLRRHLWDLHELLTLALIRSICPVLAWLHHLVIQTYNSREFSPASLIHMYNCFWLSRTYRILLWAWCYSVQMSKFSTFPSIW